MFEPPYEFEGVFWGLLELSIVVILVYLPWTLKTEQFQRFFWSLLFSLLLSGLCLVTMLSSMFSVAVAMDSSVLSPVLFCTLISYTTTAIILIQGFLSRKPRKMDDEK